MQETKAHEKKLLLRVTARRADVSESGAYFGHHQFLSLAYAVSLPASTCTEALWFQAISEVEIPTANGT